VPTRRQFLQAGIAGGVLLAGAGWWALRGDRRPAAGLQWLDESSAPIVAAIVPAVLEGALPQDAAARRTAQREVLEAFDRAIAGLAPAVQAEIAQLFSLLAMPPVRVALAGVTPPWAEATPAQAAAFLARWRESRFALLRAAGEALCQLILAAWYGNPASWAAIGYPGPPSLGERRA
jgi:hypothetical protein